MGRLIAIIAAALLILAGVGIHYRFPLAIAVISSDQPPPLRPQGPLADNERWVDDYFTIADLGGNTYAIGEPRVSGPVFSYLIVGRDRALLFDSGMPLRDMRPVVESLTGLPVTVLASHLHFDHVGSNPRFDRVAMPDTQETRAQIVDGVFTPTPGQFLGSTEGHALLSWHVTDLLPVGTIIDLGERQLTLLATPGHTSESISVWDRENAILFTGDYIYEGALYAFMPNSSLQDYLNTATELVDLLPPETKLYTAHRWRMIGTPILGHQDLVDLKASLVKIRDGDLSGSGFFPTRYQVNSNVELEADIPWYQGWRD